MELSGHIGVHILRQQPGRRIKAEQKLQMARQIAGFFEQFAACAVDGRFALFQGAGGELDQYFARGGPPVADQDERAVGLDGTNHHRAGVNDHLALVSVAGFVMEMMDFQPKPLAVINDLFVFEFG